MRAISLGLLVVLTMASLSAIEAKQDEHEIKGTRDITIMDDGSIIVADQTAIWKYTGDQSNGLIKVLTKANGVTTIRAWKKSVFYIQNDELWVLTVSESPKKLISKEALQKSVGQACSLRSIAFDANGQHYMLACTENGQTGIVRRNQQGNLAVVVAPGVITALNKPVSMTLAGESSLLVQCEGQSHCNIVCLMQKKVVGTIPLGNVTSLVYDHFGRLFAADTARNEVVAQTHPRSKVDRVDEDFKFKKLVAVAYDPVNNILQALDDNHLVQLRPYATNQDVSETPFDHLKVVPAFPNIQWAGWEPVNDKGVAVPLRPLLLTHANDNSGRNFVGTEHGVVYVFPNKPDVKETKVFLDIQNQVSYKDSQNEEGFLGLAFHPKYKQNGEFFVNYTKKPGLLTVVSRFKVSKDDPDKADLASEEVLFTLKKPMWNHSGGTICFGPDGYLYVVFGDGGGANDMFKNSRKMNTFHSKIIRIDVDSNSDGKPYGIPKDNPFVGKEGASPEIFCYGIRNGWRLSFDRKTGQGWFADVGQNLYEEINLLEKGADYGWNSREGFHPFGANSLPANDKMIEPIWEYNHLVGKSITGGFVYRGKQFPELDGWYLYADYVSAKIWAIKYDFDKKRVVANREIANRGMPIMSFGEDENGELYLMTFSASGQGIDRIVRK